MFYLLALRLQMKFTPPQTDANNLFQRTMKPKIHHRKSGHWAALTLITLGSVTALFASPQLAPSGESEIAEFIQMDVKGDAGMAGADVDIRLDHDIAILTGSARTLAQTERAASRAIASQGVRGVVNQIRVKPAPASDILGRAESALGNQKMFHADNVAVSSTGSRIFLTGKVGTWDEKDLARQLVSEVPGVVAIENDIVVTFASSRDDSQIEEQLRFLIKDDPLCTGLDLTVSVRSGVVTLDGQVGSRGELNRLVRRSRVSGVTDVRVSGLRIDGNLALEGVEDKTYSQRESLTVLRDSLDRDPRIAAKSVRSKLEDGVLTLKGDVGSLSEKDAVESSARCIPGVLHVSNELGIKGASEIGNNDGEMKFASPPLNLPR